MPEQSHSETRFRILHILPFAVFLLYLVSSGPILAIAQRQAGIFSVPPPGLMACYLIYYPVMQFETTNRLLESYRAWCYQLFFE